MISNEIIKFASNTSNVGLTNKYTFKTTKKNSMCGDLIKIELILKNSKISNFLLKNEKVAEGIAKMHPMKRIGEGGDSASVAKFLLTDESSWITGQILGVDGGRSSVA